MGRKKCVPYVTPIKVEHDDEAERKLFSDRLKELIKERNLTHEIVGESVGISRQAVSKWVSGESIPDILTAARLAKVLDVSIDYLVGVSNTQTVDKSIKAVCDYTGLTEDAVYGITEFNRKLSKMKKGSSIPECEKPPRLIVDPVDPDELRDIFNRLLTPVPENAIQGNKADSYVTPCEQIAKLIERYVSCVVEFNSLKRRLQTLDTDMYNNILDEYLGDIYDTANDQMDAESYKSIRYINDLLDYFIERKGVDRSYGKYNPQV